MTIDDQLKRALRRQPAPDDLADRIIARLGERAVSPVAQSRATFKVATWLAAAAALVMAVAGERYYEQQREAAEVAHAQQQISLALQITSEKLALVQRRLQESTGNASR
jgi:hypothetical protein